MLGVSDERLQTLAEMSTLPVQRRMARQRRESLQTALPYMRTEGQTARFQGLNEMGIQMSDTPRTDAAEFPAEDARNIMCVRADFARQLERELSAVTLDCANTLGTAAARIKVLERGVSRLLDLRDKEMDARERYGASEAFGWRPEEHAHEVDLAYIELRAAFDARSAA